MMNYIYQMKTFCLNGENYSIENDVTISKILEYFNYNKSLFVLEYNNRICQKKDWAKILIKNNDKIEIVTIVGGG
uniref:thiamine biosynthesis protein S n=1 Tax=Haslea pseudostrearia TaxID=197756 RepID=UPI0022061F18|nr:thiamine biosynthesis protein S [Haslea pseudostrearia]UXN44656.1 thiamine biosynthesis protein S [Haslea pseudostrearia]